MSSIAITGGATGTGVFSLLAPSTSTNRTINLPDSNGTILTTATAGVPVNGPAFSAYASAATSLPNATFTKIAFNSEVFDTNSCFDSTTNYRFTPTVAGYYQLSSGFNFGGYVAGVTIFSIYKNGVEFYRGIVQPNNASSVASVISALAYANGSTDYFEMYAFQNNGSTQTSGSGASGVWFNGAMVRAA